MFLMTPEHFWTMYRVNVRVETEVTRIDRANKQVEWASSDGKSVCGRISDLA